MTNSIFYHSPEKQLRQGFKNLLSLCAEAIFLGISLGGWLAVVCLLACK